MSTLLPSPVRAPFVLLSGISFALIMMIMSPSLRGEVLDPDTTFTLTFQVKMSKAVEEGIFNPEADLLYLEFEASLPSALLVRNPGNIYSVTISNGVDSGATYHFRTRINDTLYETISRQVTVSEVNNTMVFWWNDLPPATITFLLDMQYFTDTSLFNPASDTLELVGNVNNYLGSGPMERLDTSLTYKVSYAPDPGTLCIYYFRIKGDTTITEGFNRYLRVPDSNYSVTGYFNNINPARIPMTFHCDLEYQIRAGHYIRGVDYPCIVGNFNDWGGNDVMVDDNTDSIVSLTLLIDTAIARQGPLEFKYRISGDPARTELAGLPARSYLLPDTGGVYSAWYDNKNPSIPTPPWAYNVGIQGIYVNKQVITGHYSYENCNYIPEGRSLYQWYRSNDSLMVDMAPIDTATYITYTTDTLDVGKWLVFEVTPVAASGDSATGKPVRVITGCRIGAVGMAENQNIIAKIYPNPVIGYLVVESRFHLAEISLISTTGKVIGSFYPAGDKRFTISNLKIPPGMYLIRATTTDGYTGFSRFIRQ